MFLHSLTWSIGSNYWSKLSHHITSLRNKHMNHSDGSSKSEYFHLCITTFFFFEVNTTFIK
jgi:hypothetical protein